jgi:hypothetical protein
MKLLIIFALLFSNLPFFTCDASDVPVLTEYRLETDQGDPDGGYLHRALKIRENGEVVWFDSGNNTYVELATLKADILKNLKTAIDTIDTKAFNPKQNCDGRYDKYVVVRQRKESLIGLENECLKAYLDTPEAKLVISLLKGLDVLGSLRNRN